MSKSSIKLSSAFTSLGSQFSSFSHAITNGRVGESHDGKLFNSNKKGEIADLKNELQSPSKERQKAAVKKVIAAMTVGKDVSSLFPEVVNCMQTTNIELKKLVYLYVINFARTKPELAIMVVNTFRKDALDPSPLVRALSIRTMASIRLPQIVEYLVEPLKRACRDPDPYVRKTAAIAIGKLYDTSSQAATEFEFTNVLRNDLMNDSNPMVVSNAIATLNEISIISEEDQLKFTPDSAGRLLAGLSDCSEWGQIVILDALAQYYKPTSSREAQSHVEKLIARLNHANPAVVLSTIKLLLICVDSVSGNQEAVNTTIRRCTPPLLSLLSSSESPELQFIVLRNLQIIQQKCPAMLGDECRGFFAKFSDPSYLKFEKLELLTRCVTPKNLDLVLAELREYCSEIDAEFSRRAIRSVGRVALQYDGEIRDKCILILAEVLDSRSVHAVEEVVIVVRDILRTNFERGMKHVIDQFRPMIPMLTLPAAKSAVISLIGDHPESFPEGLQILEGFVQTFFDESTEVQLQLLTSTLKVFVTQPSPESKAIVHRALTLASKECQDPDLRDRALLYWRLLSFSPDIAKTVVRVEKTPIGPAIAKPFSKELLEVLVGNLGMLASVHHQHPMIFTARKNMDRQFTDTDTLSNGGEDEEEMRLDDTERAPMGMSGEEEENSDAKSSSLDGSSNRRTRRKRRGSTTSDESTNTETENSSSSRDAGPAKRGGGNVVNRPIPPRAKLYSGSPVSVEGCASRRNGVPCILLRLLHTGEASLGPIDGIDFQLAPNAFGATVRNRAQFGELAVYPDGHRDVMIEMEPNSAPVMGMPSMPLVLNVGMRTSAGIAKFTVPHDVSIFFTDNEVDEEVFTSHWVNCGESKEFILNGEHEEGTPLDPAEVERVLNMYDIRVVFSRKLPASHKCFFSAIMSNKLLILLQVDLQTGGPAIRLAIRSPSAVIFPMVADVVFQALNVARK